MTHPQKTPHQDAVPAIDDNPGLETSAAETAVAAASRAPSIHNTQPWRWELHGDVLDVHADRSRQLHVADLDGHSLLISCGAASELTELALRAQGRVVERSERPDPADPDLLVRLRSTPGTDDSVDPSLVAQLNAAAHRHSERRPFGPDPVTTEVIEALRVAAAAPGVYVDFAHSPGESLDLAVAVTQSDQSQRDDPAYAAEMASWVHSEDGAVDGVPASAIPQVAGGHPRHTDIPLRDFESGVPGGQLIAAGLDERPLIAVIFTDADNDLDRLRAGQAMMRLMISAELAGIASCPLSQSVDLLAFRTRLRALMSWPDYPQMMLRLGQKPVGTPRPTPRRPVEQTLIVTPDRHDLQGTVSS